MSLQEKSIMLASRIMTSHKSIIMMFLLGDRHHNSVCRKREAATGTRLVDEPITMNRFEQCKATRHNKEVISNTPLGIVRWCKKFRASRLHAILLDITQHSSPPPWGDHVTMGFSLSFWKKWLIWLRWRHSVIWNRRSHANWFLCHTIKIDHHSLVVLLIRWSITLRCLRRSEISASGCWWFGWRWRFISPNNRWVVLTPQVLPSKNSHWSRIQWSLQQLEPLVALKWTRTRLWSCTRWSVKSSADQLKLFWVVWVVSVWLPKIEDQLPKVESARGVFVWPAVDLFSRATFRASRAWTYLADQNFRFHWRTAICDKCAKFT